MPPDPAGTDSLAPGRLLRRPGPPTQAHPFPGIVIHDDRLTAVLDPAAPLLLLYEAALHAEGPVWDAANHRLLFSDVANRRLLAWHPDGHVETVIDATAFINGNALAPGGALHCEHGRRCISRSNANGTHPIVTHYQGKRLNAPNDLIVAPDGAVWFTDPTFGLLMPNQGSLADPELDHRSLYRFDPASGALRRMADFEQPNGLAFAPDARILYVSDTARSLGDIPGLRPGRTHDILAFDVAPDWTLSKRRLFYRTDHGVPDGLKVDPRGWLWTSAADGVHILDPSARKLGFIPTPKVATNCAFAPGRLYIAASAHLLAIDLR